MDDPITSSGAGSSGTPSSPSPSSSAAGPSVRPGSSGQPSATATAVQPSGDPSQPPQPVPYDRFHEVSDRLGKLSWAESYEPEEVEQATQLYRWFDSDPRGAYQYLTGLLKQQGLLEQQQQQQPAARGANGHDQFADPQSGRPLPDILVQETGQRLYSADQTQKLLDWAMGQVDSRVKDLEQYRDTSTMTGQARVEAQTLIAEAEKAWPYFNEFATDIYKELKRDGRLSLEGAYRRVVFPKVRERARAEVVAEIRTKASAGSGANPSSPAPATTTELRKLPLKELFRREMSRRGMGS